MDTTEKAKHPLEARTLKIIRDAGVDGISRDDLCDQLWDSLLHAERIQFKHFAGEMDEAVANMIRAGVVRKYPYLVEDDMVLSLSHAEWSRRLVDVALAQLRATEGVWGSGDGLRAAFEQALAGKVQ